MDALEERLRTSYADHLDPLDLPPGSLAAARRTGARMRTRRRAATGVTVAAVLAVAAGGSLLVRSGDSAVDPSDGGGHWRQLPAAPLSPRTQALVVWTGHELMAMGGLRPCKTAADRCRGTTLRDAAAFDPSTQRWRTVAPMPRAAAEGQAAAAVDGHVIIDTNIGEWEDYDLARNRWSTVSTPWPRGGEMNPGMLTADRAHVYTYEHGHVYAYDVDRGTFSKLPADSVAPSLVRASLVATSSGLVLTGQSDEPEAVTAPNVVLADVWDGSRWRRLPPTGQASDEGGWYWTGTHLVDPEPFLINADSARSRWSRSYPTGGILDPATGTWRPLPDRLRSVAVGDCPDLSPTPGSSTWVIVCEAAYDDATGRVVRLGELPAEITYGSGAAWVGDQLLAFGGAPQPPSSASLATGLSNRVWAWAP